MRRFKTFAKFYTEPCDNRSVVRLAGLDPAKPLVDLFTTDDFRLTRDDADFVQVIHTNSGVYGSYPRTGHVDFNINGGRMQPVCASQANFIRKAYICTVKPPLRDTYIDLDLKITKKRQRQNALAFQDKEQQFYFTLLDKFTYEILPRRQS